jgi:uncharacterized protein YegP (UPF0339 family)
MMTDAIFLFDVVRVVESGIAAGLGAGAEGTAVEVLEPGVFEVEFADEDGRAYAIEPFRAEQLVLIHPAEHRRPRTGTVFEVYKDDEGGWRWRLASADGQTLARSGRGFDSKESALAAIDEMRESTLTAEVVTA